MPIHLNPLSKLPPSESGESDLYLLPTIASIHVSAWQTSALNRTIFHGGPPSHPAIIDMQMARHKNSLLNDLTCQIVTALHCSDPEVGEPWKVIAFIKYNIFDTIEATEQRTDAGARQWPPQTNLPLIEEFWGQIISARQKYAKQLGPHVSVDIVATEPEWHGKGAGKLLMEWACQEADRRGLPMYLEGSPVGMKLYERAGFEGREVLWVDLGRWPDGKDLGKDWRGQGRGREGEGEGWYKQTVMVREARK